MSLMKDSMLGIENHSKSKALHTVQSASISDRQKNVLREHKEKQMTQEALHKKAEAHAQKIDPHYEMADRPHLTTGSKAYHTYMSEHSHHVKPAKTSPQSKAVGKMQVIKF